MLVTFELKATFLSKHGHGLKVRSVRKAKLIGVTLGHESHNLRFPYPQGSLQNLGMQNVVTFELKPTSLSKHGHGLKDRSVRKAKLIGVTLGHESHNL